MPANLELLHARPRSYYYAVASASLELPTLVFSICRSNATVRGNPMSRSNSGNRVPCISWATLMIDRIYFLLLLVLMLVAAVILSVSRMELDIVRTFMATH